MSENRTKALMIAGQCWCDPETSGIEVDARLANSFADRVAPLLDEIERLREAILRLADQDATLSVVGGNVIVQMDATLTDAEREAVDRQAKWLVNQAKGKSDIHSADLLLQEAATLRGLLDRIGGGA